MKRRKYSCWNSALSFASISFPSAVSSSSSSSLFPSPSSSTSSLFFMSSFSVAAIVVAFDVAVLSNALESFVTKGGVKDSFDLFICMPVSTDATAGLPEGKLEDVLILNGIFEYRAVLHANCSEIQPQLATDYRQVLYLILPDNKSVVEHSVRQISQFYHMIKRTFYKNTAVGKLLWMPIFLVVWPDLEDYCLENDTTTEKLIRASFHQPRRPFTNKDNSNNNSKKKKREEKDDKDVFRQTFSVNSDVYFYFGKECEGKRDGVWEVYTLFPVASAVATQEKLSVSMEEILIVQKLTPDGVPYEGMFEGILGRVRRRRDLRETHIRAVASKDPSSFLKGPASGVFNPLDIRNGTPYIVFEELRQGLNFTADIVIGDWIRKHSNGTLKGKTASLFRRGLADVTISLTSALPYRKVELSFLQPTYSDSVNGFFVQPAAASFRDIVIAPFSFGLWLSLLITYLIIVASILCFGLVYRKMYSDAVADNPLLPAEISELSKNDSTFRDEILLWAVGTITQKGWHVCPDSTAIRVAFLVAQYLGIICYGAFSAAVVSILAVELVPIKTRSDLLTSNLNFYADDASSTMAYIVNYLKDNTKVKFGDPVNIQQGVDKLRKSKDPPACYLAFPQYFYLSATAINISHSWICGHLSVIPVTTSGTPNAMVISRDSQYAELFNFIILKMIGRGLNYRYVHLYDEVVTLKCSDNSGGQTFHPLGYSDLLTAFLIVIMGGICGIAFLLMERVSVFFAKNRGKVMRKLRRRTSSSSAEMSLGNEAVPMYGNWLY